LSEPANYKNKFGAISQLYKDLRR